MGQYEEFLFTAAAVYYYYLKLGNVPHVNRQSSCPTKKVD